MKITLTSLMTLLVAFVATDVFRVVTQWNDYRIENVLVHFSFAAGVLTMAGFNFYFIKFGTFSNISSKVKFSLAFLGQFSTLFLFSNLILLALIGCKPCDASEFESHRLVNFGILLSLALLFVGFILWSKRLCMPNPAFKRDA